MAKKAGKKVNPADMTAAQQAAFQAQLALQEQALQMAQAQADRDYDSYLRRLEQARADAAAAQQQAAEDEQRAAQFKALGDVAALYGSRAKQVGSQYDVYGGQVQAQREAALRQLSEAAGRGEATIGEAEQALLRDLVATQAYQDVPLVELGQIQNPLLAGLAAEGASAAGVESETAQAQQAAAQLAAMTRGAMRQLNVGEENYLRALQNAGRFAAAQSRQDLAGRQFGVGQGIRSEYDQLAQQIAQQRLSDVGAAELQAAEAKAQQTAYQPIVRPAPMPTMPEPAFDYAAQLEAARKAALASIRSALPAAGSAPVGATGTPPAGTAGTDATTGKPPTSKKKSSKKRDPWTGTPTYIPNESL